MKIILSGIILLIFFGGDLFLLRKKNAAVFRQVFYVPGWIWAVYVLLTGLLVYKTGKWNYLPAIGMMFFFPVYILKRLRYHRILSAQGGTIHLVPDNLDLAIDAAGVLITWILGTLNIALWIQIYSVFTPQDDSKLILLLSLTLLSLLLIVFLIHRAIRKYPQLSVWEVLGLKSRQESVFYLVFFPVIVGLMMAAAAFTIIYSRQNVPMTPLSELLQSAKSPAAIMAFLGMAVLLAPFLEEIIFRGYFYYVLERLKGKRIAIPVIAIIFALMHVDQYWGDWLVIAIITLLGFVLTYYRALSGSCIGSIITHYVFNGGMTIIPVIVLVLSNPFYYQYQVSYKSLSSSQKETLLRKSIESHPDHKDSYNDLAWLYAQEDRNLDQALKLIDAALSFDENNSAYLDTKTEVLYKLGRIDEARQISQKLVDQYPQDEYFEKQLEKSKGVDQ